MLFTDGGKEIWIYELADISFDAVSYIPIVSSFVSIRLHYTQLIK